LGLCDDTLLQPYGKPHTMFQHFIHDDTALEVRQQKNEEKIVKEK
jgi:hypothetical protein